MAEWNLGSSRWIDKFWFIFHHSLVENILYQKSHDLIFKEVLRILNYIHPHYNIYYNQLLFSCIHIIKSVNLGWKM